MYFVRLLASLPLGLLHAVATVLFFIAYRLLGYRRAVVRHNIALAFPEKSEAEKLAIERQFYRNLADLMVEIPRLLTVSGQELAQTIQVRHAELLAQYLDKGQPVIIMAGHLANWELVPLILKQHFPQCEMAPVYKQLSSPFFHKLMLAIRSRFGCRPVLKEATLREAVKLKKSGVPFCLGLIADQSPAGYEVEYWTHFFGQETAFYVGADKLAKTLGYPVLFSGMRRVARGRYELVIEEIKAPPYDKTSHEVIEIYRDKLEAWIRQQPADWLWSHKRWKHKRQVVA